MERISAIVNRKASRLIEVAIHMHEILSIDPRQALPDQNIHFDTKGEPIFALMITGKDKFHARFASNAILSFLAQSYGNRFLIVINDGEYRFDLKNVPLDRIRQIQLNGNHPELGTLRNMSLDRVPEEGVWIQWDDDDWYHPDLIAKQYEMLETHKATACFLRYQVKYAFSVNSGWADYFPGGFAGTLMARKRRNLRYDDISKGEDSIFCRSLKQSNDWIAWDNPPHYYLRFIHGRNTWNDEHFQLSRRTPNQRTMLIKSAEYLDSVLSLYAPIFTAVM